MKKIAIILVIYIFAGWTAIILLEPSRLFAKSPALPTFGLKGTDSLKYDPFIFDHYDKLAYSYIISGRELDAMKVLLDSLKEDRDYRNDIVTKNFSFDIQIDSARITRWLNAIDTISLIFRLGERIGLSEAEMQKMLSIYMRNIDSPASLWDYVFSIEYKISYHHFQDIDRLLNELRRHLHSHSWNPIAQLPFVYYYPYLKGRYLLACNKYEDARGYVELALKFRPEYSGVALCDLADSYLKVGLTEKARLIIDHALSKPRETPEFALLKSHYR